MKKLTGVLVVIATLAVAGCDIADPDCTPEKAAKRQVQQATIGVSNRCTPAETARDTARIEG